MRGRKVNIDERTLDEIREYSRLYVSQSDVANALGISKAKFNYWLKNVPAVQVAYHQGKGVHVQKAIETLQKLVSVYTLTDKKVITHYDANGKKKGSTVEVTQREVEPNVNLIVRLLEGTSPKAISQVMPMVYIGAPPPLE